MYLHGGIVGYAKKNTNAVNINNCTNLSDIISVYNDVGGIVGGVYGNIQVGNCKNEGEIWSAAAFSGGIVGMAFGCSIGNSENIGSVTSSYGVGGIAGGVAAIDLLSYAKINNCKNSGNIYHTGVEENVSLYVEGNNGSYKRAAIGGIAGWTRKTTISETCNTGTIATEVTRSDTFGGLGGIAGWIADSEITKCYNTGDVNESTAGEIGGISGYTLYNCKINNCYNTGKITGERNVGGISGYVQQGDVRYCYNIGTIEGGKGNVGGITGRMRPHEAKSYTKNYFYYCYNGGTVINRSIDK